LELSSIAQRNKEDLQAGESLGIAATRESERMAASRGKLEKTPIEFLPSQGVEFGGVLFLLPSLLATGLLSYNKIYNSLSGYYDLDTTILSLAFMYLCRIKNPEQLKHHSPGELGKLLGLDRVPEAKTLRKKISEIVSQKQASKWNIELAKSWVSSEENIFFYIDGHVQVYSGHLANLGKKHISRLKLCLPGVTEFWVNNSQGLPYFVVTGEVNEKMQEIILSKILPELINNIAMKVSDADLKADPDLARFTLVFDREAYSPKFFDKLWKQNRVAVLTYKKNVQDQWSDDDFTTHKIKVDINQVEMDLAEKTIKLDNVQLREVRKKNSDSHQTSIITTNKKISTSLIASNMFARWTQENFFKYLMQDYDLDRIAQYTTNKIDDDFKVVNPIYSKLTNKLKKIRAKIARRKVQLYDLIHKNIKDDADKTEKNMKAQIKVKGEMEGFKKQEKESLDKRKEQTYKITIKEMEEKARYNKLDFESKLFQNIIKMICYRAETSFSILLASNYKKKINEFRTLAKNLIKTKANIIPDYQKNTLTVELYSLSNPRDNKAAMEICENLNDTKTKFPGTELEIIYKFATV